MKVFSFHGEEVIDAYGSVSPWFQTITIPFATFSAANAITNEIPTELCSDDVLVTEIYVNFFNAAIRVSVQDSEQNEWSQRDQFFSIHLIAGSRDQTEPNMRLPIEYALPANSRLLWKFQNAATSPITTNQTLTLRGVRLKERK